MRRVRTALLPCGLRLTPRSALGRLTDPGRADAVLYWTAETVRQLAILVRWAIPESADRLLDQLNVAADARDLAALAAPLAAGTTLPAPAGVFPRLDAPADE